MGSHDFPHQRRELFHDDLYSHRHEPKHRGKRRHAIGLHQSHDPASIPGGRTPTIISVTGGKSWTIGLSSGVIQVNANSSSDRLDNGDKVEFTITAIAPSLCAPGVGYTWSGNAGQAADCSSTGVGPISQPMVTVAPDTTPPVLSVPAETTVECDAVPAVGSASATDNCDSSPTVTYEGEARTGGPCPDTYTLTRTWKAADNCSRRQHLV